jgi:hypothetical protein
VIVPIPGINRAVVQASTSADQCADVRAVLISTSRRRRQPSRTRWERQLPDVPLVIVESPYRALSGRSRVSARARRNWPRTSPDPGDVRGHPEYVARNWWERILYNQSANRSATGSDRPAAHGGRRRSVPARREPTLSPMSSPRSGKPTHATRTASTGRASTRLIRTLPDVVDVFLRNAASCCAQSVVRIDASRPLAVTFGVDA